MNNSNHDINLKSKSKTDLDNQSKRSSNKDNDSIAIESKEESKNDINDLGSEAEENLFKTHKRPQPEIKRKGRKVKKNMNSKKLVSLSASVLQIVKREKSISGTEVIYLLFYS